MELRVKTTTGAGWALALCCWAAVSCGGNRSAGDTAQALPAPRLLPTRAATVNHRTDNAVAVPGPVADPRLLRLLLAAPAPPLTSLPELPALDTLGKLTSATVDSWQNGTAASSQSAGALAQGTALVLPASASGVEWAIFRFSGIVSAFQLQQLKLDTTGGQFSGTAPGYWVAVANYTKQNWEVLGRSALASYSAPLGGAAAYLSPNNATYVAVLITGGQSVTVNRAGLTLNSSPWQSITLAAGQSGLTPCIDFTAGNNPAVAWADSSTGHGYFAVCDRTTGFGTLSSWSVSPFEEDPAGASVLNSGDPTSPNAQVQWLDLIIDPGAQLPRISCLYTGLLGTNGNTRLGCTALGSDLQGNPQWWNWRMAFSDGAYYTSIARNALDASYAIVYTAGNQIRTTRNPNDMEYRTVFWQDAAKGLISTTQGDLIYGFGDNWINPHMKFSPAGKSTVVVAGGYAFQNTSADLSQWGAFYNESFSLSLGSLAYAPAGTPGMTFCSTGDPGQQEASYVGFNAGLTGPKLTADIVALSGNSNAIAECSQLAYQSDGTPCIAYTYRTAQGIDIKYAFLTGGTWTVETVSAAPGTPANATDPVFLDLAVDAHNVPAVCWTQRTGTSTAMLVALRGA